MNLSTAEQLLVEQRVTNEAKSTAVAYLLWILFGGFGAHRFYIGRTGSGIAMIALLVIGFGTASVGIGALFIVALGVWLLADLFLIPGMIHHHTKAVRENLSAQVYAQRMVAVERAGRATR